MCHILQSSRFEVQVVAMAHSSSMWPTYFGQCPCCRSFLEIDRYGCCLIRDDVVRSCTTQLESEADSEDMPVVPTVVVSDSDDDGFPIVATPAPNAADAVPTAFYPEDAASAWSCAAPNAAAVVDATTTGATAFGAAPSNAVVGAGSMASSSSTGAGPRPSSGSIAGSTAAGSLSKCGGQRARPWPKQASRDASVMDAGTKWKRE